HLEEEVVTLAGALTDAGEDRHTTVRLRDVVDELHDENGLADAGATEEADLATFAVRREKVDDLDAGLEDFDLGALIREARGLAVDRHRDRRPDRTSFVDRSTD